ncbi:MULTISPECIES: hypothetical protein [unclassified Roseitalea]|uniref:hypothetical protein n=1 Tax=unclassified Roseitalea TaxID=2639107 RepID=UPI00320ADE6C
MERPNEPNRAVTMDVDWLLRRMTDTEPGRLENAPAASKRQWLTIVERHLARERNKGLARHWSYSLNRHIALKAARDRLRGMLAAGADRAGPDGSAGRRPRQSARRHP